MRYLVLVLALLCSNAFAVLAFLVNSRTGTSVTGQMIWICTYDYGGRKFEKVFPSSQVCPPSIEIQ